MPIASSIIIASGSIYAGYKAQQQTLPDPKKPGKRPSGLMKLLKKADAACQRFFETKVDPLIMSKEMRGQAIAQGRANQPRTEEEKNTNRLMVVSVAATAMAAVGMYAFPPLILPTILLSTTLVWPLLRDSYRDFMKKGQITLDLLTAIYVIGFWVLGYYFLGALLNFLYFISVKAVLRVRAISENQLTQLFVGHPQYVWMHLDGLDIQVPYTSIRPGDLIVVNAGEPVPIDGKVVRGEGTVDQQALTGESQPAEKLPGDPVFAATLLVGGKLYVRVEQAGEDTLAAQITKMLHQTAERKTKAESTGETIAQRSVMPTIVASILAFPVSGVTGSFAVLGSSIGLNIRMVSVLSTMNYLSMASKRRVLIKDGQALEDFSKVDMVVFDKTGTLTEEQPTLAATHPMPGYHAETILTFAAAAEYRQKHPVARAILAAAQQQNLELPPIQEANYQMGFGIKVLVEGKVIRVGSQRFMEREGLPLPDQLPPQLQKAQEQGHILIYVGIDQAVAGILELKSTLRPGIEKVVEDLRKRKIGTMIISGDQEAPTRKLASELGIDSYYAQVLPEQKANIVRDLQFEGKTVCYIGDGINDAVVLKQANVSASLSGATTVAKDAAQIIFIDHDLSHLSYLIDLSKQYNRTMRAGMLTCIAPGLVTIGGVFVAGFGLIASEVLFNVGMVSGLAVAMKPLLKDQKNHQKRMAMADQQQLMIAQSRE